jgi:hypothetical protein
MRMRRASLASARTCIFCSLSNKVNTSSRLLCVCFMKEAAWEMARGRQPTLLTTSSALVQGVTLLVSKSHSLRSKLAASRTLGSPSSITSCRCPAAQARALATSSVRVVNRIFPRRFLRGRCSRMKARVLRSTLSRTRSQSASSASSSHRRAAVSLAPCSGCNRSA